MNTKKEYERIVNLIQNNVENFIATFKKTPMEIVLPESIVLFLKESHKSYFMLDDDIDELTFENLSVKSVRDKVANNKGYLYRYSFNWQFDMNVEESMEFDIGGNNEH